MMMSTAHCQKHIPVNRAPPFNLLARTSTMAHLLNHFPLSAGTASPSPWNRLRALALHALAAITLLARSTSRRTTMWTTQANFAR